MQVVHPVCCGLDVHQATLVCRVSADGQSTTLRVSLAPPTRRCWPSVIGSWPSTARS